MDGKQRIFTSTRASASLFLMLHPPCSPVSSLNDTIPCTFCAVFQWENQKRCTTDNKVTILRSPDRVFFLRCIRKIRHQDGYCHAAVCGGHAAISRFFQIFSLPLIVKRIRTAVNHNRVIHECSRISGILFCKAHSP